MDPRDINFTMRSGIGNGHQPVDPNDALTLMAVTSFFMEKAYGSAATYAKALNHPEILAEDIVLALKYHALPTSQFMATTNLVQHVGEWRERLLSMMSAEEDDEDEAARVIQSWWRGLHAPEPSESEVLALVDGMHNAELAWGHWSPQSDMDRIVHRAVERAAAMI